VTHDGKYHADDVFACAVLVMTLEKQGKRGIITRTRDMSIIDKADYVIDVGTIYDPVKGRFDHHQPEGAGARENKIPYASFGILWKEFGMGLCENKELVNLIDTELVQGIDASDNGIEVYTKNFEEVGVYTIGNFFESFRGTWKETITDDEAFFQALAVARRCLERKIKKEQARREASELVEKYYQESPDKRLIYLEKYVPWSDVITKYPEPLFVVSQDVSHDNWILQTVRNKETSFINRKDMPAVWAGLRNQELANITGVPDALFCHKGLWIASAKTKEGIMRLATIALNN